MSIEDLNVIKEYGVDGVLIGELFMRKINDSEFKAKYKEFRNNK